jgi:hypothetical protein
MSKTAVLLVIGVIILLGLGFVLPLVLPPVGQATGDAGGFSLGPKELVQMLISALLLAASLFVILSAKYAPKDKHWAYTTVGTILGFWFRT